jgi:hypothetical protein
MGDEPDFEPSSDPRPPPPGGGFGASPPVPFGPIPPPRPPSDRTFLVGAVLFGGVLLTFFLFMGWGEWKKVKAMRAAEARNDLGQIAKALVVSYEVRGELCPSSAPVPARFEDVRGKAYRPAEADWRKDPGWSCIGFAETTPIHYQYRFERADPFFTIVAAGDVDGDDVRSTYELHGHVEPGAGGNPRLVLDPSVRESNPGE